MAYLHWRSSSAFWGIHQLEIIRLFSICESKKNRGPQSPKTIDKMLVNSKCVTDLDRHDYYWVDFDHFKLGIIFKAAGAVLKIYSSLKPNHHQEI